MFAMEVNNPLDQAITAIVMATYRAAWAIVWLLCCTIKAIAYAIAENIGIIAKLAAIVGVTLFVVTFPHIVAALALIALFAYVTYPKGK